MDTREKKPWGSCRMVFMAHMKTIQERLEAGEPLSKIHRELQETLDDMPYGQFTHYVRKHLKQSKPSAPKEAMTVSKAPLLRQEQITTPKQPTKQFVPPETAPDMSQYT